jgi:hypothetical protein
MQTKTTATAHAAGVICLCMVCVPLGVLAARLEGLALLDFFVPVGGFALLWFARRSIATARARYAGSTLTAIQALSLGLLCLGVLTSSWNGLRAAPGLAVCDVFFVLAATIFACAALLGQPVGTIAPKWLVLPAYCLLCEVFFSGLAQGSGSILPGVELVAAMLLTPLVIGVIAGSLGRLWLVVDCWILSVAVNAAVGTSDYFAHTHIGTSLTGVTTLERVAGLTTQENHLAFACVFALPIVVARLLQTRSLRLKAAYLAAGVLMVTGLLGSGSRGGAIAGVFVLATIPFFQPAVRGRAIRLLSVAIAGVVLASVVVSPHVSFIAVERVAGASGVGVEKSDEARSEDRLTATEQFDSSPLYGVGFTTTLKASSTVYLSLLAAGGLLALTAWLAFSLGAIRSSLRLARSRRVPADLRALSGAVCGTLTAWLLLDLVENQLYDRYLFVPCGLLIASLILNKTTDPRSRHETLSPSN